MTTSQRAPVDTPVGFSDGEITSIKREDDSLVVTVRAWNDAVLEVRFADVIGVREALAGGLGIAEDNLYIVHVPGAGCYGHNGADDAAADAALVARARSPCRQLAGRGQPGVLHDGAGERRRAGRARRW